MITGRRGTLPVMGDEHAPLRAIVAERLSRLTDATTHLTTKSETMKNTAAEGHIVVVAETEDPTIRNAQKLGRG